MVNTTLSTLQESPIKASSRIERRVWPRYACDMPAECQPVAARANSDVSWPTKIRNISVGGVGLVLDRRFERGTGLAIAWQAKGAESSGPFLARVAHATTHPDGLWLLGCAFLSKLSNEELQDFLRVAQEVVHQQPKREIVLDRLSARPVDEQLVNGVRKSLSKAVLLAGVTLESATPSGESAHLLARRLHLAGRWPPAVGSTLRLTIPISSAQSLAAQVRVEECSQREGRWTMRYTFTEKPSAALLSLFGLREVSTQDRHGPLVELLAKRHSKGELKQVVQQF